MKMAVFIGVDEIIIVGVDKDSEPIDEDGTLFGPESGRKVSDFDEVRVDPSDGTVVIIQPRMSIKVL